MIWKQSAAVYQQIDKNTLTASIVPFALGVSSYGLKAIHSSAVVTDTYSITAPIVTFTPAAVDLKTKFSSKRQQGMEM